MISYDGERPCAAWQEAEEPPGRSSAGSAGAVNLDQTDGALR